MPEEVSPAGFRFGLFCNTTTDAALLANRSPNRPALPDGSSGPGDEADPSYFHDLGMLLEERLLLAQGASCGVFPSDEVSDWLANDDPFLPTFRDLAAAQEELLPPFSTSKELLSNNNGQGADEFRSTLFFRDDERAFELDSYCAIRLFGSDDEWTDFLRESEREADQIFSSTHLTRMGRLTNIFDSVTVCANLLSYLAGEPQESLSPWHIAVPGLDSDPSRVDLPTVAKLRAEAAAQTVRSVFAVLGVNFEVDEPVNDVLSGLKAALIIKYAMFALMPNSRWDERFAALDESLQAATSLQMFSALKDAGPQVSWAATAWRLAPSDSRSLSRQRQAVELLLGVLRRLQDEGLEGERVNAQLS